MARIIGLKRAGKLSVKEAVDARMDHSDRADTDAGNQLSIASLMADRERKASDAATQR